MRRALRVAFFLLLFAGAGSVFSAGRPEDSGQGVHVDDQNLAVQGADVVAYYYLPAQANAVYGKSEFGFEWKGATWLFVTEENLEKFREDPSAYAPQYGGYCAYAMAQDRLARSNPDAWTVHEGRLYLNNNLSGRARWRADMERSIRQAGERWPDHLKEIESRAR